MMKSNCFIKSGTILKIKYECKMRISYNILTSTLIFLTILFSQSVVNAQGGNNNAFLFNGTTSQVYVNDGAPANSDANQNGFKFFKSSSTNNKITVQAWVYLLGDNPGVKMPIVYRAVDGGTTFSIYVKDNKAYFTVGNSPAISTQEFPAFTWVQITGSYDGTTMKIYNGGTMVQSMTLFISPRLHWRTGFIYR